MSPSERGEVSFGLTETVRVEMTLQLAWLIHSRVFSRQPRS